PAGLTAGVPADPTSVEAYYSGLSTTLIEENFQSSKNIYFGLTRDGEELIGFDDYLRSVVGGPDLVADTETLIEQIDQTIAALPTGRLSENLDNENVTLLRNQLQDNTANFKSSMSSLLGISITFNSGDGD
ncbi:MAG: imelysin family protein, partial [Bacteroidota bacterium]